MGENAKKPTIDPAKWKIFLGEIRFGLSMRGACGMAELDRRAVDRAMADDPDLMRQFARARADIEREFSGKLQEADSNCEVAKWTWLLSRKMPGDYSDSGIIREMADTVEALTDENAQLRDEVKRLRGSDSAPVG